MSEKFIPWPDYAICPNCGEKVDVPKRRRSLKMSGEHRSITCPECNTPITYVEPGLFGNMVE